MPADATIADTGALTTTPMDGLQGTLTNLASGFFDAPTPQQAYASNLDPRVSAVAGSPNTYRLTDEGGDIIQWAVDALGGVASGSLRNISMETKTGNWSPMPTFGAVDTPAASAPTASPATTFNPGSNTGAGNDLLSNLLTGNNAPVTPSGLSLNPITYSAPVTTTIFKSDTSNRSTTNNTTNVTSTTAVNDAGLFNSLATTLTDLFKSVPLQAAANFTPSNDAALTRGAAYPGNYAAGQSINTNQSTPGASLAPAGIITGLPSISSNENTNRILWIGIIVSAVGILIYLFKGK